MAASGSKRCSRRVRLEGGPRARWAGGCSARSSARRRLRPGPPARADRSARGKRWATRLPVAGARPGVRSAGGEQLAACRSRGSRSIEWSVGPSQEVPGAAGVRRSVIVEGAALGDQVQAREGGGRAGSRWSVTGRLRCRPAMNRRCSAGGHSRWKSIWRHAYAASLMVLSGRGLWWTRAVSRHTVTNERRARSSQPGRGAMPTRWTSVARLCVVRICACSITAPFAATDQEPGVVAGPLGRTAVRDRERSWAPYVTGRGRGGLGDRQVADRRVVDAVVTLVERAAEQFTRDPRRREELRAERRP
ncbi:hypothetical protein SGRIM128S_00420 [Streptomyces griseomycini]